jgi:hypothetical protein
MDIEFTNMFDDLTSGWEQANKTAASNLIKRCLVNNIVKKEGFNYLLTEINNWDGRIL